MTTIDPLSDTTKIALNTQFRSQMGKISGQSGIFFAGTLFTIVVGYFFKVYIARALGAEALGLYTLGLSLVGLASLFGTLGLPNAVARYIPVYTAKNQHAKVSAFVWASILWVTIISGAMAAVLWLLRDWVTTSLYDEPELRQYMLLFVLLIPIGTLSTHLGQVMRGFKDVARRTLIGSFIQLTLKIIFTIGLIALGWQLRGYVVAEVASGCIALLLLLAAMHRLMPPVHFRPTLKFDADVSRYAASMFGIALLSFLAGQGDRILLGVYLTAREVGVYSVAITTAAFIPVALTSVNSIFGPIIAELHTRQEKALLRKLFQTLTKWSIGLTMPLVIVMVVFAPTFMRIFGAEFETGWQVLVIIAAGQVVNVGVGSVGNLLIMSGHQRVELMSTLLTITVTIALYWVLIPREGIVGAAIAVGVGIAVANLLRLWQVRRLLNIMPYNRTYWRLVPALLLCAMVAVIVRELTIDSALPLLPVVLLALVLTYLEFLMVIYVWGFDKDDWIVINAVQERLGRMWKRG